VIFMETGLAGAFLVELDRRTDERGYFARSFCTQEFSDHGLPTAVVQCNVSFNRIRGTLRGMHFQRAPLAEAKLVRCTRGAIYDVIVDLRRDSPTYCRWYGTELTEENGSALFVPEGFAHGFQTLADKSEVFYQMFAGYSGEHADGVRWDDPAFGISWPLPVSTIADRDRSFALLRERGALG